jgi:hypothetical protein
VLEADRRRTHEYPDCERRPIWVSLWRPSCREHRRGSIALTLDTEAVVVAVSNAVDTIPLPPPPPPDLPLWFAYHSAMIPGPGLEPLVDVLRHQPDVAIFDNHLQQIGHQGRGVSLADLARWLVSRARTVGAGHAVSDLARYLKEDTFSISEVCLLTGVNISESVDVANGIRLLPFDQVPDSSQKRMFTPTFHDAFTFARQAPTAALMCHSQYPKHHVVATGPVQLANVQNRFGDMNDARLILALIVPNASSLVAFWANPDDAVPLGDSSAGWQSTLGQDSGFHASATLTPTDLERLRSLYPLFCSLNPNHRQHLRLPLERLSRAVRRHDRTDSAIELGIALEALLLNDMDEERGELTLRFRLRGARLLGQTPEERAIIYRVLGQVYRLRSHAVHRGAIPEQLGRTPAGDILTDGYRLAARAIETLIRQGQNPNWEQITLA